MVHDPFQAPGDDVLKEMAGAKPAGLDTLLVRNKGRGLDGGARKALEDRKAAEPEPEPLDMQAQEDAAQDKPEAASTIKLSALAWSAPCGVFNERITASAKAELPPDKQHLTRMTFTLYAQPSGGRERIDSKDGHLKNGRAEVEFTLYYPQHREDGELPEQCEYIFTVKHRESEETASPTLEVSCRDLTLKSIREILEGVEMERDYEAAKLLACALDYDWLCSLAEQGGEDNDPNQMPTRFLLLPGMDDGKLKTVDPHPATEGGEPHAINITNLRIALNTLGFACAAAGPFDSELLAALKKYLAGKKVAAHSPRKYVVKKGETLGGIAQEHGLPDWGSLYKANEKRIGSSPHLLREGTELEIPAVGIEDGKSRIRALGPAAEKYFGKSGFRYPWSLLSIDLGGITAESEQPLAILFSDRKTGALLWSGESREIRVVIPDSEDLNVGIKGCPLDIGGTKHIHPEDEKPVPI